MNSIKTFLFLIPTLILLNACKNPLTTASDSLTTIPPEVSSVTSIDIAKLMEKVDYESVKKMEFFQENLSELRKENPALAKVVEDPKSSGIDLNSKAYFYIDLNGNNPEESFSGFVVSIADKSKFESLLTAANVGNIVSKEGYQQAIQGGRGIIAWNDKTAVMGGSSNDVDLGAYVAKIFTTSKENSVANNDDLKTCFSGNHDIMSWFSSNTIAANPQAGMMAAFANIDSDALKDNFMHSFVDFEKGEINSTAQYFLNKGLTKDLDLFFKDEVKTDFSKYVPAENLNFAMSTAIDFNGINQVLSERPQAKSFANFALKEYGLTLDNISDAFNGDLLLSTYENEGDNGTTGLFMTKISNIEVFYKFSALALEYELITKSEDGLYQINGNGFNQAMSGFGPGSSRINTAGKILIHDDMMFISGDENLLANIKAGSLKGGTVKKDVYKLLSGQIFGLFTDFDAIKKGRDDMKEMEKIKDIRATANRKSSTMNIEMHDKKVNSLKLIFEAINNAYLKDKDSI